MAYDLHQSIANRVTPAANLSDSHNLQVYGVQATCPAVGATFSVGAEATDVRTITIQLTDATGAALTYRQQFFLGVFTSTAASALATTGGSTGIAASTNTALGALIAKKLFFIMPSSTSLATLTWTDTSTETVALGVFLPSGKMAMSDAFANA